MTKKKEVEVVMPTSPADQEVIRKVLEDVVLEMRKKESINDVIKDHIDSLSETFDLPKSLLKKMARTLYKDNYESLTKETETFEQAFETIIKQ